jgi:hypothetical protein
MMHIIGGLLSAVVGINIAHFGAPQHYKDDYKAYYKADGL